MAIKMILFGGFSKNAVVLTLIEHFYFLAKSVVLHRMCMTTKQKKHGTTHYVSRILVA
jgi:hypothetical protein